MQIFNPFLPIDTYIPDGEPHVFDGRVYLYGSHDKEGGTTYCQEDYVIYSAAVDDLTLWRKESAYSPKGDPLYDGKSKKYTYAPDCVRGNDGKYYLYYCFGGYGNPICVAVSDKPGGPFRYYGQVKNRDGSPFLKFVTFDPAVINDDGVIRLYYGAQYPFASKTNFFTRPLVRFVQSLIYNRSKKEIKVSGDDLGGAFTVTLSDDMLTVTSAPKKVSDFVNAPIDEAHSFYEGSSIRKIGNVYYFIYSSFANHELCYATSLFPDKDFKFCGTIISNGDVYLNGRLPKDRLYATATNHGSIENINGSWYVFYHRNTHGIKWSRQACAEKIEVLPNGEIPQVEITSCGLNGGDLIGDGKFPAVICCNLTNGKMPHGKYKNAPMVTHSGNERYLANLNKGTVVTYKYFDLSKANKIILTARGKGVLSVDGKEVTVQSGQWNRYSVCIAGKKHQKLTFEVLKGNVEILSFEVL